MQNKLYKIPDIFRGTPFFQNQTHFCVLHNEVNEILLKEPFYFDMLSIQQAQEVENLPWNHPKEFVPVLFNVWKHVYCKIEVQSFAK